MEIHNNLLDKAPVINGEKEWYCGVCKTSNVWTRKRCTACDERIPSWVFRFHWQSSEEQQVVRYESSSGNESMSTVAMQHRIAAERDRKQKEMEAPIAKLRAQSSSGRREHQLRIRQTSRMQWSKARCGWGGASPYGDGACNGQKYSKEALLYIFEDNEAVIKMIIKGRSPSMRNFPEPTELLLIGCLKESIWTPRSKSNTLTPRTNSQTY